MSSVINRSRSLTFIVVTSKYYCILYGKIFFQTYTANGVPLRVTDEKALNGVIHVVDSVVPSTDRDVLDVLKQDGRFNTFLESVQASDLVSTLRSGAVD